MGRAMRSLKGHRGLIVTLCVFALVLAAAIGGLNAVADREKTSQTQAVREAALRCAVACYSVEGVYPQDAEYLKENYGLHYDEDRYILTYDAFADNILPDVQVLTRGE